MVEKGDVHQIRKDNRVLELARNPDKVQRILVHGDLVREGRRVVRAQPGAAVGVDADAEVTDAGLEASGSGDVGDGLVDVVVDLGRVRGGRVAFVVEGYEEDVWH